MTILITGSPGWLGTRFAEMYKGDKRCLVLPNVNADYLKSLGTEIVRGDVTKPETLKGITEDVDTVFHCAGIIHPRMLHIDDLFNVNAEGTSNLLHEAIKTKTKFIYISSNSVAGVSSGLMNEYTPRKPYMKYGDSKFLAEELINRFHIESDMETVILRPCWYYGPRQPKRQSKLINMVKNGKALLFGDGRNLRSMTYIDNLCDAMILAEKSKKANGETYWIADERPYTMFEIYSTIAEILGVKLGFRKLPKVLCKFGEVLDRFLQNQVEIYQKEIHVLGEMDKNIACSIEKAKKDLNYKPKIELKEGMRRSIEWMREEKLI